MTIKMKRKIYQLSHEYYKARGVGILFGLFEKRPEANQVDNEIHKHIYQLERIGFSYPRKHGENDKDYQYRLNKVLGKHREVILKNVEMLNSMIDEIISVGRKQEA